MDMDDDDLRSRADEIRGAAEELIELADSLFDLRSAARETRPRDERIGEIASDGGQFLTAGFVARNGQPTLRLRLWAANPSGRRFPLTFGMDLPVRVLPQFAGLVARACRMELEQIERGPDERRPRGGRRHRLEVADSVPASAAGGTPGSPTDPPASVTPQTTSPTTACSATTSAHHGQRNEETQDAS
jgi:hypothetical protein